MENNKVLKGYISYYDTPIINNQAIRSMLKLIFGNGKKKLTSYDTPVRTLNEYRQAVFNKIYEREHPELIKEILDAKNEDIINENKKRSNKKLPLYTFDEYNKPTVSYDNYNPIYINGKVASGIAPNATIGQHIQALLFNDPSYEAQMTSGSFNYTKDKDGNVKMYDIADINKGTGLPSLLPNILHEVAKKRNKKFVREYDLGNINDWGMKYTGNEYLRPFQNDNQIGLTGWKKEYNHQMRPDIYKEGWLY